MISVEARLLWSFRELGLEHEVPWVWQFIQSRTDDFMEAQSLANQFIERRQNAEPLAYILGEWPFMGLILDVGPGVLIPRPETEELCDMVVKKLIGRKIADKNHSNQNFTDQHDLAPAMRSNCKNGDHLDNEPFRILDVGSGTGALGLGAAHALLKEKVCSGVEVVAIEKSEAAFAYLLTNAEKLRKLYSPAIEIKTILSSWNEVSLKAESFHLALGNPPYVSPGEWIEDVDKSVKNFEPQEALTPRPPSKIAIKEAASVGLSEIELVELALGPLLENLEIFSRVLTAGGLFGIEFGPAQLRFLQSRQSQFKKLNFSLHKDLSEKSRFVIGEQSG